MGRTAGARGARATRARATAAAVALAMLLAAGAPPPAGGPASPVVDGGRSESSPARSPAAEPAPAESPAVDPRWASVRDAVAETFAADPRGNVRLNLLAADSPGSVDGLVAAVAAAGGVIDRRLDSAGLVVAQVPARGAPGLVASPHVAAASVAGPARLAAQAPPSVPAPPLQAAAAADVNRTARPSLDAIAAAAARPADGTGALVALIDTGADVGHPALQFSPDGSPKIVDWVDFSGEGDVRTVEVRASEGGEVATTHGRYRVLPGLSAGGTYRFGLLREENLNPAGTLRGDLNGDGDAGDAFGLLVVDRTRPGEYDAVIVDVNQNFDFTDDLLLREFRNGRDVGVFPSPDGGRPPLHFVLSRIEAGGSLVQIGFDGHGHGTQVASIAAGNPRGAEHLAGVAPGARLMVLKALDSAGDGSWDRISEAMAYAAEHGAQVVSLSVAGAAQRNGLQAETVLMSRLSRIHNVLFTVAAGNGGPGLGSANPPGDPADTVVAGAFLTPAMWRAYWQYDVPRPTLAEFSAAGPRRDGGAGPTLVAPGATFAGVPAWVDPSGYALAEGTSVAVPHAAGAAAVALDLARQRAIPMHFQLLKRALESTASALPGYAFAEQGWGALHLGNLARLIASLEALDPEDLPPPSRLQVEHGAIEPPRGLYVRGQPTTPTSLRLGGASAGGVRLRWASTAPWLHLGQPATYLPDGRVRTLGLRLDPPAEPGLHSAVFAGYTAEPPPRPGRAPAVAELFRALELPVTVVRPYPFSPANRFRHTLRAALDPGDRARYFFEVPEGADALELTLRVPPLPVAGRPGAGGGSPLAGRVRMTLVGPDGHTVTSPDAIGAGPTDRRPPDLYRYRVSSPLPGVWEVVVVSLPDQGRFGLARSEFQLDAALSGVIFPGGAVHLVADAGRTGTLRQQVSAINIDRDITGRVVGVGFGRRPPATPTELISIADGEIARISLGEVPLNATWLRVSLANPSPPGGYLDPLLWRYDVARQAWVQMEARPGGSPTHQTIELLNPPPGRYTLMIAASDLPAKRVELQVRHEVLVDTGDLRVTDADRPRRAGEPWQFDLEAALPAEPGRYFGRLAVYDADARRLIGSTPVILHRSLRAPRVRALPPLAEGGPLVLEVRDRNSGELLEATLTVAGRPYATRAGRAQVEPPPAARELEVIVEGADVARAVVAVAVPPAAPVPNPRAERELELLRRKVGAQSSGSGGTGDGGGS